MATVPTCQQLDWSGNQKMSKAAVLKKCKPDQYSIASSSMWRTDLLIVSKHFADDLSLMAGIELSSGFLPQN